MKVLAIDLGGSSAKIGLFNSEELIGRQIIPTDKDRIWENIKENLKFEDDSYDFVSISMPGFIDEESYVRLSGNLGLKNYNAKKELKKIFVNKQVYVLNDANAAALGEFWHENNKKYKSMILYTLGTGIGGGIVIDNKLVVGSKGYAGELGHGGNFQTERSCTCGLSNCIEPVSSARGITWRLKDNGYDISVQEAGELLRTGNKDIARIFNESLKPLAEHINIMQLALNPDFIAIGGGPSNIGEPLIDLIKKLVRKNQLNLFSRDTIKLAETKNDAGMIGAYYWAKQNQEK